VAVKENYSLVVEAKIMFSHLFAGNCSDITKISSFLNNKQAVDEFANMLRKTDSSLNNPTIIGGFASFAPKNSKKHIPKKFVFLSISKDENYYSVDLAQNGGYPELFKVASCSFKL
jgi:hypothetical protein